MNLSILILTHNRPELFKRCIASILKQIPDNVQCEILVNNDTNDIEEILDHRIRYFYKTSKNISVLYKYLFDNSSGEYIYFLEDDDYLSKNFFRTLLKYPISDLYYMNYKTWNIGLTMQLRKEEFLIEETNCNFQLSQILFKKELVNDFPDDNSIDNDWKLYKEVLINSKQIVTIQEYMFIQTIDGKDNISFPHLNKDNRWNIQNKVE